MSDTDRVQRWRQRQRQAGKEPLTIWLTTEEKLRLEDQALRMRLSPSELVQRMLAQWHGESSPVTDTVTDTEQLRALVQHELALSQHVSATVADTVTATLHQALPALVRALLQEQQAVSVSATVTDTVTATSTAPGEDSRAEAAPERVADTVTDTVTDTSTAPPAKRKAPLRQRAVADTVADTVPVTDPKHRGRKPVLRPGILALLGEHPEGLTAAELKVYLQTEKPIGDTLAGMVKAALLVRNGSGHAVRYQRAGAAPGRP